MINNNERFYKKISTKNQSEDKECLKSRKRKICEEYNENPSDIWNDYRYSQYDTDVMNSIIEKYSQISINKKIISKKRKTDINIKTDKMLGWVSGTKTKNYLLNDLAIDWLNLYYGSIGITSEPLTEIDIDKNKKLLKDASHIDILFEGGNIFEKKIFDELKDIYKNDFVLVFNEDDMKIYREQKDINGLLREKNEYVKSLMNMGIPIIAQAPMINDNNKTFGIADILIRSDYLQILFEKFSPDADINVKAPLLTMCLSKETKKNSYHYRVIDCKWTTMVLCVDGLTIRNDGMIPAYKGQLAVYTAALEELQGFIPNYAYIMAKSWKIDKANILESDKHLYKGFSAFDRPGVVNYTDRDREFLKKTKEAIQWSQRVMTVGREWRYGIIKPSVPELYPNMNKSFNPVYDKVKDVLANRYGDPTMVWYVGTHHRDHAHSKGIYDIRDPACTLDVLGINKNTNNAHIIEQIIEINKTDQVKDIIRPNIIKNNLFGWKDDNILDYFVDFETINYNLFVDPYDMDIDNAYFDSDVTFMIGFGFKNNPDISSKNIIESLNVDKSKCDYIINVDDKKGWEFICLYLVRFELKNELEMFRIFYQFIILRQNIYSIIYDRDNSDKYTLQSRLFHWTPAEIRFMRRAVDRIRSTKYTKDYMDNKQLQFNDEFGNRASVNQVQLELDRLIDNFDSSSIWIDMCKVFESVPIVIKGSYRFKLKHIGNAFYKNGLIETKWADGRMSDGFRAMLEAIKLYRTKKPMNQNNIMYKEIIDYNEVDCRVIWEIVNYLRSVH